MQKICIVLTSLGVGGAQRAGAILSQLLENRGYTVTIIITQSEVSYEFGGQYFSVMDEAKHKWKMIKAIKTFLVYRELVVSGEYDCIIDGRHRGTWLKQWFINTFIYKAIPTLYIIHNHNLRFYFPEKIWMAKNLYHDAAMLIGVSKAITKSAKEKYGLTNVQTIENTTFPETLRELASNYKVIIGQPYILYYGRLMDSEKNICFLIDAYQKSMLPSRNVQLVLLGSGKDEEMLKARVISLGLDDSIVFIPFTNNPFPYVKNALFTVLTSHFEGFPMVLIEALMLETPVVSVDCPSGPSEVIRTGYNGILVPQEDELLFIEALDKMIMDKDFYRSCKKNTLKSVSHLLPDSISDKWVDLLNTINN